jgi:hypothetical protein
VFLRNARPPLRFALGHFPGGDGMADLERAVRPLLDFDHPDRAYKTPPSQRRQRYSRS